MDPATDSHQTPINVPLDDDTRLLFREYCGLDADGAIAERARDVNYQATKVFAYRCIREFRFLAPRMKQHSHYPELLKDMGSKRILDVGCCTGTDIRQLIADGARQENLVGIDVSRRFMDLGYELFGDANRLTSRFVEINIIDPRWDDQAAFDANVTQSLGAPFDCVFAGSVLHLLGEEDVVRMCRACMRLTRPGGVFVGRNVGNTSHAARWEPTPEMVSLMASHDDAETAARVVANEERLKKERERHQLQFLHTAETLQRVLLQVGFLSADVRVAQRMDMPQTMGEWRGSEERCFLEFVATRGPAN